MTKRRRAPVYLGLRNLWNITAFWLALTVALGHSVLPVGSPVHVGTGSAFSASTADVALTPSQRSDRDSRWGEPATKSGGAGLSGTPPILAAAIADIVRVAAGATLRPAVRSAPLLGRAPRRAQLPRAPPLS